MEYRMDIPMRWKRQFVIDFPNNLFYCERSFFAGFELGVDLHFEVPCVQPHLLTKVKWGVVRINPLSYTISSDFVSG